LRWLTVLLRRRLAEARLLRWLTVLLLRRRLAETRLLRRWETRLLWAGRTGLLRRLTVLWLLRLWGIAGLLRLLRRIARLLRLSGLRTRGLSGLPLLETCCCGGANAPGRRTPGSWRGNSEIVFAGAGAGAPAASAASAAARSQAGAFISTAAPQYGHASLVRHSISPLCPTVS